MLFSQKVPPKNDFQSITEEPKYPAKALTVVKETITAGAAVVVTIPSLYILKLSADIGLFKQSKAPLRLRLFCMMKR